MEYWYEMGRNLHKELTQEKKIGPYLYYDILRYFRKYY